MRLISFVRDTVPVKEKKNTKIKEIKCLDEKITSSEDGDQTLADVLYSNDDTEKEAIDRVIIHHALSQLTDKQRDVVVTLVKGYSLREVADMLNIKSVWHHRDQAKKKMKEVI